MPPPGSSEEQFALISGATSGNNTVLAAVTGKRIRVIGLCMVAAATVTARFESAADGTALTGVMTMITGVPITAYDPLGLFEQDVVSELLNLELGGAVQVSGFLTYLLID